MIGKWNLNIRELVEWQNEARKYTREIKEAGTGLVDLTGRDITPYQVGQVLESLEWEFKEEIRDKSDAASAWNVYTRDGNRDIIVYYNALTFELAVYLYKDKDNFVFKNKHSVLMEDYHY